MRIAILIGVSTYDSIGNNLPGCKNDITALKEVLIATSEFQEVKIFEDRVQSSLLKEELTNFFNLYKGQNISELFFYFTGHGSYHQDDFYYLLSDYDDTKRRQTSLQNSEIDKLIKSLNPEMVIKIIDACQSGVSYIKTDNNIVEKYYQKTGDSFKKCYFLHSSMTNQYSYQNNDLSHFTKSILNSIKLSSKNEIRYKDVIDHISDEFESITEQTPFFVTQADFTEPFIKVTKQIKDILSQYIVDFNEGENIKQNPVYSTFIDYIKKDAEIYSSEEEVKELLSEIKDLISKKQIGMELGELFEVGRVFENHLYDLPKRKEIGVWIEDNKNSFFANPTYKEVEYEDTSSAISFSMSSLFDNHNRRNTTKYKNVVDGFDFTIDVLYKSILIEFLPKYPNLSKYACLITFLISKKDIKFFHSFTDYIDISWSQKKINSNFKWLSSEFSIKSKENIFSFIDKIYEDNCKFVLNILKKKYEIKGA